MDHLVWDKFVLELPRQVPDNTVGLGRPDLSWELLPKLNVFEFRLWRQLEEQLPLLLVDVLPLLLVQRIDVNHDGKGIVKLGGAEGPLVAQHVLGELDKLTLDDGGHHWGSEPLKLLLSNELL